MSQRSDLENLLKEFTKKSILIVGDVMVDEYLWGTVTRISPEAPVPVVSCSSREHRMGGAANVAINISSMGATPYICSVIGNDDSGRIFLELMNKRQMPASGILVSGERQTSVKTRVIGNHQHLLRVDHEMTGFLDHDLEQQLITKIMGIIRDKPVDAVIFQDYDKGVLTPELIDQVTDLANEKGIPALVDPKKRSFHHYRNVTLFKPNFKELTEGLNLPISKSDYDGIFEASVSMIEERNIGNIMVTLSEKGVFICDRKGFETVPALERDITDVSGAGDTVISIAALVLASGKDAPRAARLANIAGGLVCERVGVVPITPEMMLRDMHTD